jgi:hypothetical protein
MIPTTAACHNFILPRKSRAFVKSRRGLNFSIAGGALPANGINGPLSDSRSAYLPVSLTMRKFLGQFSAVPTRILCDAGRQRLKTSRAQPRRGGEDGTVLRALHMTHEKVIHARGKRSDLSSSSATSSISANISASA